MEPMNSFLNSNRESFKRFIEEVCSVPHRAAGVSEISPSYSTPHAIKSRLPTTSKEGFPSLPFLLDEGREYANLVELWIHASSSTTFNSANEPTTSPLRQFDEICRALQARTQDCLSRAERAERPSSELSFRWEEVVDGLSHRQHDSVPRLDIDVPSPSLMSFSDPHLLSSDDPGSLTPVAANPLQQRDWENAPDAGAGAAAAAASLLGGAARNHRQGFVLTSPGILMTPTTTTPPPPLAMMDDPISPSTVTRHSPGLLASASSSPRLQPGSRPASAMGERQEAHDDDALAAEHGGDATALPRLGRKNRSDEAQAGNRRGLREVVGWRREKK